MLPGLQVLYVHVELQCCMPILRNQRLVEVVRQRHVADAEEGAVLYVILGVQIVDGMLGVQQWLGVAGTSPCQRSMRCSMKLNWLQL